MRNILLVRQIELKDLKDSFTESLNTSEPE